MFMTLNCSGNKGKATSEMQHLHATDRMGRPNNMSSVACSSCRKKKLRCSREKKGCHRCQQRGIRCVYDTKRSRGRHSKPQEGQGAATEDGRQATPRSLDGNAQQPAAGGEGGRPPSDVHGWSTIQVAVPGTSSSSSRRHSRDQHMSSASDSASRSSYSYNNNNNSRESTRQQRPHDQRGNAPQGVDQGHVTGANGEPVISCPEITDPSLFLDFTEDYLSNPHESFTKLLDPFGTDVLPSDQSMRTCSSKCGSTPYSNSSGPTQALSSMSSPRNWMEDAETDPYDEPNTGYDDEEDCECTETALQMLEKVAAPSIGSDWAMAETKVLLLRNSISQCLALSHCRGCKQESGICMLTFVVYEKLTAMFEQVALWWSMQGEAQGSDRAWRGGYLHQREHRQQPWPGHRQKTGMAMGRYQIDTDEEHRAVLAAIIALQLQRLSGLAEVMVEQSRRAGWQAHVQYGEGLRRRMKSLEEMWKS